MEKFGKFLKLKTFVYQRTLNRVKRQCAEWQKLSENHLSHQGLIFRTYKELPTTKQRDLNNLHRYFSKEDIQTADKHKRCEHH